MLASSARLNTYFSKTFAGPLILKDGVQLNPDQITGEADKNRLYFKGANYAADLLVLRYHPELGLQGLFIVRAKSGFIAIPGGMSECGESEIDTARRELREETGLQVEGKVRLVSKGKVIDPREDDHSWVETSVYLHLIDYEVSEKLDMTVSSPEIREKLWLPINSDLAKKILPEHYKAVAAVVSQLRSSMYYDLVENVDIRHNPIISSLQLFNSNPLAFIINCTNCEGDSLKTALAEMNSSETYILIPRIDTETAEEFHIQRKIWLKKIIEEIGDRKNIFSLRPQHLSEIKENLYELRFIYGLELQQHNYDYPELDFTKLELPQLSAHEARDIRSQNGSYLPRVKRHSYNQNTSRVKSASKNPAQFWRRPKQ